MEDLGLSGAMTQSSVWSKNKVFSRTFLWPKVALSYREVRYKTLHCRLKLKKCLDVQL
uniref:Uncharacterized protein n=1 Tax=Lepeophtheirus salmonis TaxID=72036 RepID=A0A0K2TH82_LEPSM